jgi:ABC-type Mn2+/Zn2+ transport system permease subunit
VGLYGSYWLNSASGPTVVLVESAVFAVVLTVTLGAARFTHPSVALDR